MKRTPLHEAHTALGARMAPFAGWDMPIQYAGILAEHAHTRARTSIFDTCHMGEFDLRGPTAEADLERLLTQRVSTIQPGQCRYGYLLRDDGGVLDDLTCYRRGEDRFLLVVNAGTLDTDAEWIRSHLRTTTTFTDLSPRTAKLDIQGPASRKDIELALGVALPDLKYFRHANLVLADTPCMLSRTGYTGEWGYELYFPWEEAPAFWRLFLGNENIRPAGLGARDTLRLEMGYPLYGHELSTERTPFAASRGQYVDWEKDFIGKAALIRDRDQDTPQRLVGLRLDSRRAARAQDPVLFNGRSAGIITSGSLAPSLGAAIAMAYVDAAVAESGRRLEIAVHGKTLPATVVERPFYRDGTARGKQDQVAHPPPVPTAPS